ncbi:MAG: hypothetical protein DME20_09670 [Verrucomicrobia bacterium]|nr:MAG: hypothetical protein DME20_09670 [Verrucomicrobiota bacterium]
MKKHRVAARINEVVLVQQDDRPAQITLDQLVALNSPGSVYFSAFGPALPICKIDISTTR